MRERAFTLLELMIVVIIVGILATLAIPQFTKAVEKAKWAECVQTLGAIRRALEVYYAEFGDYPSEHLYLNGSSSDSPAGFLGIDIPEPDAQGRYVYMPYSLENDQWGPVTGFHDEDIDGERDMYEPRISLEFDGRYYSENGAPEF